MSSVTEEIASTSGTPAANQPLPDQPLSEPAAAKPPVRLAWPHLVLGVIGFFISLFSFYQHHLVKAGGSACGISNTFNCDKVLTSPYAEFFGIPLGMFGMAYFVVVILTGVTTEPLTTSLRKIALPRVIVASAGLLGSIALTYISITKIKALCPVCLATHTTILLNFIFATVGYLKARRSDRAA